MVVFRGSPKMGLDRGPGWILPGFLLPQTLRMALVFDTRVSAGYKGCP